MFFARASMLFSTNSATALSGLLCDNAIIRIAFQLSPMRNRPESVAFNQVINDESALRNQARNSPARRAFIDVATKFHRRLSEPGCAQEIPSSRFYLMNVF